MKLANYLSPKEKDLGGFTVRRMFPSTERRTVGPWVFFDHMGPATFTPHDEGINVRPHPHINLATVTYLFEGEILHRDSLNNQQAIQPGAINLMVAGKGIVHSERERDEMRSQKRSLHGLQLWFALPEDMEEIEPAFYHYEASDIPSTKVNDVSIRVMMGQAYGITSPVKTFSTTLYAEAYIKKGGKLKLPETEELAIYLAKGEGQIANKMIEQHHMAVIEDNNNEEIIASSDSHIIMIGGENLGKRFIEWNFVSSKKSRIEQAKQDWKNGLFPRVPGDEKEFIPLPE